MTTAWGRCSVLRTRPNPAYPLPLESIAEAMRSNSFSRLVCSNAENRLLFFTPPEKSRRLTTWTLDGGDLCCPRWTPRGRRTGDSPP